MKVSKGQSQPKIAAAAFLILYMVLDSPFLHQVLIVTQVVEPRVNGCARRWSCSHEAMHNAGAPACFEGTPWGVVPHKKTPISRYLKSFQDVSQG